MSRLMTCYFVRQVVSFLLLWQAANNTTTTVYHLNENCTPTYSFRKGDFRYLRSIPASRDASRVIAMVSGNPHKFSGLLPSAKMF
jgi:hypothetical protein